MPEQMGMAFLESLVEKPVVNDTVVTTKRRRRKKTKDGRWQCQFRFWLNANDPQDNELGHQLAQLKDERRYHSTIRDALRLIFDLRAGRTDVLFELFPTLKAQLQPPPAPVDLSAIERRIAELQTLMSQPGSAVPRVPSKPLTGGVVVTAGGKADAQTVANNFLKQMSSAFSD